jgi:hypothetical protein
MSASAATLSPEDYESRKTFLQELKAISTIEQQEIYRILKESGVEYSENHNGVFFDICKLPADIYAKMKEFMDFCRKNREDFAAREESERQAHEALHG